MSFSQTPRVENITPSWWWITEHVNTVTNDVPTPDLHNTHTHTQRSGAPVITDVLSIDSDRALKISALCHYTQITVWTHTHTCSTPDWSVLHVATQRAFLAMSPWRLTFPQSLAHVFVTPHKCGHKETRFFTFAHSLVWVEHPASSP